MSKRDLQRRNGGTSKYRRARGNKNLTKADGSSKSEIEIPDKQCGNADRLQRSGWRRKTSALQVRRKILSPESPRGGHVTRSFREWFLHWSPILIPRRKRARAARVEQPRRRRKHNARINERSREDNEAAEGRREEGIESSQDEGEKYGQRGRR